MADELKRLKEVPLFEGLSRSELRAIVPSLRERWFNDGETIVEEGSAGGPFFLIAEGRAKLVLGGKTRKTFGPGQFFGEISVIDGGPRSATIVADGRVRALSLTSYSFKAILDENPPIARKVMAVLCARIRELDKSLTA